jgi:hypothetical protein
VPAANLGMLARMGMKLVFWTYLVLTFGGLAYFIVIGLTHH